MWLLLIRPQRRKQAAQQQMLSNLQIGDDVMTAGGLYGRIVDVDDTEIMLEIAAGTTVRVARRAVAGIVTEEDEEEEEAELEPGEEEPDEAEPDEAEPAALEPESHAGEAEEAELDTSVSDRRG